MDFQFEGAFYHWRLNYRDRRGCLDTSAIVQSRDSEVLIGGRGKCQWREKELDSFKGKLQVKCWTGD